MKIRIIIFGIFLMISSLLFCACGDNYSLKSISVTGVPEVIKVGDVFQISVAYNPSNASDKEIDWTTTTPNIVKIEKSATGIVAIEAINEGDALIIVTAKDGNLNSVVNFHVYPMALTLQFGDNNKITRQYNSEPQVVEVINLPANIEVNYEYQKQDGEILDNPPTKIGNYKVTAKVSTSGFEGEITGVLEIVPQVIKLKADDKIKTYGEIDNALTLSIVGGQFFEKVEFNGSLKRVKGEQVGSYDIVQNVDFHLIGEDAGNYKIEFIKGNYTINKKELNILIKNQTSTYGTSLKSIDYIATGFAFDDDKSVLGGAVFVDNIKNIGVYDIQNTLTAKNYELKCNEASYTIAKAPITINIDNKTSIFGKDLVDLTYTIVNPNNMDNTNALFAGDEFTGGIYVEGDLNIGSKSIKSNLNNDNYEITVVDGIYTISKRQILVGVQSPLNKIYGSNDPTFIMQVVSTDGLVGVDKLTGQPVRETGENVGVYEFNVGTLNVNDNYEVVMQEQSFTIKKAPLVINLLDKTQIYGENAVSLNFESNGLKFNDSVVLPLVKESGQMVGTYAITKNADAVIKSGEVDKTGNYDITINDGVYTISKRDIKLKVISLLTKNYGQEDPTFEIGISSNLGLAFDDEITGAFNRSAGEDAGEYAINAGTLAINDNYNISITEQSFVIKPLELNITIDDKEQIYGESVTALTYQNSDLVGEDTLVIDLVRASGNNVGEYEISNSEAIKVSNGELDKTNNYKINVTIGKYKINKRDITVKFIGTLTKVYGTQDPTIEYEITSPLKIISEDESLINIARESGQDVATYELSLSINNNYNITYAENSFTITQANLTIDIDDKEQVYGNELTAYTYTHSILYYGDEIILNMQRENGENVGDYTISPIGTPMIMNDGVEKTANYNITINNAKYTITQRDIELQVVSTLTKVYGENDPAFVVGISPTFSLAFSDEITGQATRETGENVGEYAMQIGTLAINDNYNLTLKEQKFVITKRDIELQVVSTLTKVYGENDPAFVVGVSPTFSLAFSDVITGQATRETGENVGEYAMQIGTLAINGNYNITLKEQKFVITKRDIELQIVSTLTKVYGENDPAFVVGVSPTFSLAFSDEITGQATRETGENVGEYAMQIGTLAINDNYNITIKEQKFVITKRDLNIIIDNITQDFGEDEIVLTYKQTGLVSGDTIEIALSREQGTSVGQYIISGDNCVIKKGEVIISDNYKITITNGTYSILN